MIRYKFYRKHTSTHYVYIDMHISGIEGNEIFLQLPNWRPGRYEPGNFAKNIKKAEAFDQGGKPLNFTKTGKDRWRLECGQSTEVIVTYSYYAADLNAGSTFSNESQLYVNPVNCCMYIEGRTNEEHVVELDLPENYAVASSLKREGHNLIASGFGELADSPFIASADLQSKSLKAEGVVFHLHFNGICRPDWDLLTRDFQKFISAQLKFWGDFPVKEYHFLFQILPVKYYHGVEHLASTVIAIGPGHSINAGRVYEELLGVSSHELFHAWNIKTIRPHEMLPYDYTKENYSRSGFVYEGFTTYYGDKFLYSADVFNLTQYFNTLEERISRHMHNYGRFNLSVADSSFDTWLDGYVPGAPYRKTSIYDEGSLVAFMLDVTILRLTGNERSLGDVCRLLYERFGKKNIGYTSADVQQLCAEVAGSDFSKFFGNHVFSPGAYDKTLGECLKYLGIDLIRDPSPLICERFYGFKISEYAPGSTVRVVLVAPESPAWHAELFGGDEIIAVNGIQVKNNLNDWLGYFSSEKIEITVITDDRLVTRTLVKGDQSAGFFPRPLLKPSGQQTPQQKDAFAAWRSK
jgi:predicted metalloprotease with PDZ domain